MTHHQLRRGKEEEAEKAVAASGDKSGNQAQQQQQQQQQQDNKTTTTTRLRKSKSLSNLMQQQQQQKQQKQKRAFAKGETVIQNEENSMKLDKDEEDAERREHKIRYEEEEKEEKEEEELKTTKKTDDDDFEEEGGEKPMKRVASMKAMMMMEEEEEDFGGRKKTPPGSPLRRTNNILRGSVVGGLRKTATIHSHASVLDLMQISETREEEDRAGKLLGRLHISSQEEVEELEVKEGVKGTAAAQTQTQTQTVKEDDSNLVSAAGLEVIISPSSSFPKDFTVLRELGKGLCGTVYLARLHDTKQLLAFKVMQKSKLVSVGEEKHAAYERHVHMDVSNGPFIATLFHSYDDPTAYYLLTEYAPCGDLFQCLVYHGLPSLSDAKVYISQVSAAIAYLHVKKYVYRDLKPENILLRANGDVCLADFGMATKLEREDERAYSFCGTSQYMSPEVMSKKGCRFEADLWSLGVLIYELCSGATPYANVRGNHIELYEAVMSVDANGGVWCPHWFDADTVDIVRKLLRLDELARLGAGGGDAMDAYFSHPWFHNGEFKCDLKNVLRGEVTPALKPRKRNIVYDLRLQNQLECGNVPCLSDEKEKFVDVR
ncbi:unnamed protein product [Bathycoccus prasinos]